MKVIVRAATVAALFAAIAVMLGGGTAMQAQAPAAAPAFEPLKFHHVHLNSVDPAAAAAYYPKPFAKTATQTKFNGLDAVKTGNIYILFTKVATPPKNELTGPQTSVWHFGWNTPNSRETTRTSARWGSRSPRCGTARTTRRSWWTCQVMCRWRRPASRRRSRCSNFAPKGPRWIRP